MEEPYFRSMLTQAGPQGDRLGRDSSHVGRRNSLTFGRSIVSSTSGTYEVRFVQEPETPDEEQFVLHYGARLMDTHETLLQYRSTRALGLANTALHELYKVIQSPSAVKC